MNALLLLFGLGQDVLDEVGDGIDAWFERVLRTARGLKLALSVPFGLFLLAMLIGRSGMSESADAVAQVFMDFAGLTAVAMLLGVVFNITVLGQLLTWASMAASKLTGGTIPALDQRHVANAGKQMLAAMAWISLVCCAGMLVPLWRNIHWTMIIMVVSMGIALIAMTWGFKSKAAKYIASAFALSVLVVAILQFNGSFKRFGAAATESALVRIDNAANDLECDTSELKGEHGCVKKTQTAAANLAANSDVVDAPAPTAKVILDDTTDTSTVDQAPPGTGATEATVATTQQAKKPRIAGNVGKQIDDLYGDL